MALNNLMHGMNRLIGELVVDSVQDGTISDRTLIDIHGSFTIPSGATCQLATSNTHLKGLPRTFIETPTKLKISSTTSSDSTAGTGCQKLLISGLDEDYNSISEVIDMNGTTAVETTNLYYRNLELMIIQNGTKTNSVNGDKESEGTIYCGTGTVTAGVPAVVYRTIEIGQIVSNTPDYTIPSGKTAYIKELTCFTSSKKSAEGVNAKLAIRANGSDLWYTVGPLYISDYITWKPYTPIRLYEKSDIQIRMANPSTNNIDVVYNLSLLLVDN